jgi:hypothetical protein
MGSKYDKEREALGINVTAKTQGTAQKTKKASVYDKERQALFETVTPVQSIPAYQSITKQHTLESPTLNLPTLTKNTQPKRISDAIFNTPFKLSTNFMDIKNRIDQEKAKSEAAAKIPNYNSKSSFYNTPVIGNMLKKDEEKTRQKAKEVLTADEIDILSKGLSLSPKSHNMGGEITAYYFDKKVPDGFTQQFQKVMEKVEYAKKGTLGKVFDRTGRQAVSVGFGDSSAKDYAESAGIGGAGKVGNVISDVGGTIAGFMVPTGSPGVTLPTAANTMAKKAVNKLFPVAERLANKAGKRVVQATVESLPYSAQQIATQREIDTPKKALKTAVDNALFAMGAELGIMGLSGIAKTVFKKLKGGQKLTVAEKEIVNNTPELRALPEAKQYLMLEAPKLRTPDVIESLPPKPTTAEIKKLNTPVKTLPKEKAIAEKKADFTVDQYGNTLKSGQKAPLLLSESSAKAKAVEPTMTREEYFGKEGDLLTPAEVDELLGNEPMYSKTKDSIPSEIGSISKINDGIVKKAKSEFGITTNPREAGYILDDGTVLDFSGKREGGPANERYMDHREVQSLYDDLQQTAAMTKFMDDTNAVRISVGKDGLVLIDITGIKPLSEKQVTKIKQISARKESVVIDYYDNINSSKAAAHKEFDFPKVKDIEDALDEIQKGKEIKTPLQNDVGKKITTNETPEGVFSLPERQIERPFAVTKGEIKKFRLPQDITKQSDLIPKEPVTKSQSDWVKSLPKIDTADLRAKQSIKEKLRIYGEAANNVKFNVPEQYRKETPFTVAKSTVPPKVESKYATESVTGNTAQGTRTLKAAEQVPLIESTTKNGVQKLKTPEEAVSKVYSNTLKKTPMLTDVEKKMLDSKDYKYDVKSEKESIAEAQQRLAKDFEGEVNKLSEKESFTGSDIDTMFGIVEKNLDEARKTGDYSDVHSMLKNVRKGGTESGRGVQAFAKYSRTTEGKLATAQGAIDAAENEIKKTNPNLMKRIDDEVAELAKKTEKTPKVTKKDEIRSWLDSKEAEATQRVKDFFKPDTSGLIKMRAGLPGDVLTDLAIVGATKLAKASMNFADWSVAMIKEFGDKIKPYLKEVFAHSNKVLKGGSKNLPKPRTIKDITKNTSEEDIRNLVKKKYGVPVLEENDIKFIVEKMDEARKLPEGSYKQKMLEGKVAQMIANKIPSDMIEKVKAVQRMFMLINPKTVVTRNPVGNLLLGAVETVKNVPAAGIDTIISAIRKSERTTKLAPIAKGKASLKGAGKGLKEWALDIVNNVDTNPTGAGVEMPKNKIFSENHKISNPAVKAVADMGGKAANFVHSIVGKMLSLGDRPFYESAYASRIAELKKIKKTNIITDEMEEMAREHALERTLQNDSWISKKVSSLGANKNDPFVWRLFVNLVVPFKKTPGNILDKFIDYSPAGAFKAVGHGLKTAGKGTFNQRFFVNTLARSLTGMGLAVTGYLLAKNGLVTSSRDSSNKVENIETALGKQNYAFKIGDKYYSYDWALPASAPIAMGADFYYAESRTKDGQNAFLKGTESSINLLFRSTMLQGLSRLTAGYSPAASIGQTLLGSTTQFTPTAGKQIAQLRDPYQRETYDPNWVIQTLNKTKVRIPVLSEQLPAKVDVFGNDVKAFQGKNNVWNVLFNPGFTTEFKPNEIQKEIIRLYNDTGSTTHIPVAVEKYIDATKDHPKIILTADEYTNYQKTLAKYTFDGWATKGKLKSSTGFNGIIPSDTYKNVKPDKEDTADEKRIKMLGSIIENAKKQAKAEILERRGYKQVGN